MTAPRTVMPGPAGWSTAWIKDHLARMIGEADGPSTAGPDVGSRLGRPLGPDRAEAADQAYPSVREQR
jgi:hypothetical protein